MRNIHIVNPSSGLKKENIKLGRDGELYETKGMQDEESYIYECCMADPNVHFTVYGGDGTVNGAVNGIMRAGREAQEKAVLSIVPAGTGNDLVRSLKQYRGKTVRIDLIRCNDRYCANSINIGFDCDVVGETNKIKKNPLISGSMGYILGVVRMLAHKPGTDMEITLVDDKGEKHEFNGKYLLADASNGAYCGGGFMSAPAADLQDGYFDALVVNNIKRPTFMRLVSCYRKGSHVDRQTASPQPKFADILNYRHCTSMTVSRIKRLCIDGEMYETDRAEISIVPSAINVCVADNA